MPATKITPPASSPELLAVWALSLRVSLIDYWLAAGEPAQAAAKHGQHRKSVTRPRSATPVGSNIRQGKGGFLPRFVRFSSAETSMAKKQQAAETAEPKPDKAEAKAPAEGKAP